MRRSGRRRSQGYVGMLTEQAENWGREYSSRYIGSLVADFHRTLLEGWGVPISADEEAAGRQAEAVV